MAAKANEQYEHVETNCKQDIFSHSNLPQQTAAREEDRQHPHHGLTNTPHCTAQMQSAIHCPP